MGLVIFVRFTEHPRWKNIKQAKKLTNWSKRFLEIGDGKN